MSTLGIIATLIPLVTAVVEALLTRRSTRKELDAQVARSSLRELHTADGRVPESQTTVSPQ